MGTFIDRLAAYGANTETGLARFAGDEDLYERCFYMLLEDETFANLKEALDAKDFDAAFREAHALKGVVGNLDLTPLYQALSTLVESLRASHLDHLEEEMAAVDKAYESLKEV